ncbi:hypothetical protein MBLNU13_g04906t2 [Cladosporium sp. NU13]
MPRAEEQWNSRPAAPWAEGNQRVIVEQLLATTAEIRGRMWQGKPHAVMGLLCVHPGFQRQGMGKELVQWGSRKAAELDLTVHLEASPEGLPLYRSLNETLVVGADQWDGKFERRYVVMHWVPARAKPENVQHCTSVKEV